jgi:predicted nucleic-acid-binding protein
VIGIDTNLLTRYLVEDDALQLQQVDALFDNALKKGERLRVCDVVLSELVWVLRKVYRIPKAQVLRGLQRVISNEIFAFEDREVVVAAYADYRDGAGDFPDYLIGRRNAAAGCEHTVTFDKDLAPHPAFVLL